MTREQKIHRWAERELQRNINHLILEHDDGGLLAFGTYDIRRNNAVITVYQNSEPMGEFGSRRVALSWCVAHRRNLCDFTQQIQILDQQQRRLCQDLENDNRRRNQVKNSWFHELITYKIQNKQQSNIYKIVNRLFNREFTIDKRAIPHLIQGLTKLQESE